MRRAPLSEARIVFRLPKQMYQAYQDSCAQSGTTMSADLRRYVSKSVRKPPQETSDAE